MVSCNLLLYRIDLESIMLSEVSHKEMDMIFLRYEETIAEEQQMPRGNSNKD